MQSRLYENLVVKQTGNKRTQPRRAIVTLYILRYIGIIRFLRLHNSFTVSILRYFGTRGKHVMNTGYRWSTVGVVICPCPFPPLP